MKGVPWTANEFARLRTYLNTLPSNPSVEDVTSIGRMFNEDLAPDAPEYRPMTGLCRLVGKWCAAGTSTTFWSTPARTLRSC